MNEVQILCLGTVGIAAGVFFTIWCFAQADKDNRRRKRLRSQQADLSLSPPSLKWCTDEALRRCPRLLAWLNKFPRGPERQNAYDTLCAEINSELGIFIPDDGWIDSFVTAHPAPDFKMGIRDVLKNFPDLQDWLDMHAGPRNNMDVNSYIEARQKLAAALAQLDTNPNVKWILTFIAANPPPPRQSAQLQLPGPAPAATPALPAPPATPAAAPAPVPAQWPRPAAAAAPPPPPDRGPQELL